MSTGLVRVGVIGTGSMGTRHVINLQRFVGGATVAGVYDVDRERAQHAAALGGPAQIFNDPLELINASQVDAVVIASPDDTHLALTQACLAAGKPVLCEKPLAASVEAARQVLEVEVAIGRRLVAVGFMRRFDPSHVAVKTLAVSGEIGLPLLWKGVHRNARAPYGSTGELILINSAGHDIDSARFLLGEEVQAVYVRGLKSRPDLPANTRDLLLLQLLLTNDRLATGELYINAEYGYEVSAEVVCQRGTASTIQPDKTLVRAQAQRGFHVSADWLAPFQAAYVAEAIDWIESIRTGRPFQGATAWDGYMALAVSTAAIESLHTGAVVTVNQLQRPALYQ